jgi:hypothetical protein
MNQNGNDPRLRAAGDRLQLRDNTPVLNGDRKSSGSEFAGKPGHISLVTKYDEFPKPTGLPQLGSTGFEDERQGPKQEAQHVPNDRPSAAGSPDHKHAVS